MKIYELRIIKTVKTSNRILYSLFLILHSSLILPEWLNCSEGIPSGVDLPTGLPSAGGQVGAQDLKLDIWTVYALSSLAKRYVYVGLTQKLERRFKQHQAGRVRSTKSYRPKSYIQNHVVQGLP